ncbi:MAG: Bacterial transcriptional regulator, partial [Ramlibacter sp.]|nr:Bacterial transcriptional regulator [Ramlibacter sp.]
ELIPGAVSLAAPVFDGAGEVGGALVVFGPEVRLPAARIRELSAWLVEKAGTASALLGRG